MEKNSVKKLKLLHIMQMLYERTNADMGITTDEILRELERRGIRCERKSIYADIRLLREFGLPIQGERGRGARYRLTSPTFLPVLRFSYDADNRVKHQESIKPTRMISVELRFTGQMSKFLAEMPRYKIERVDERTLRVEIYAETKESFFIYLLRYKSDVQIAAPESMRTAFKDFLWDILRKY